MEGFEKNSGVRFEMHCDTATGRLAVAAYRWLLPSFGLPPESVWIFF